MFGGTKSIAKKAINRLGYDVSRIGTGGIHGAQDMEKGYSKKLREMGVEKAHYGCGPNLFDGGWVNLDLRAGCSDNTKLYLPMNLVSKHPFPSDFFRFGFAEDFLEHLDQSESLIFLSEVFRCLQPGGVLRLSFPGLRGVLRRHYRSSDYEGAIMGQKEAYTNWGHKHFFCEEGLETVAKHIGFCEIAFVDYGISGYQDLCSLDTRPDQRDLNIYAELTK